MKGGATGPAETNQKYLKQASVAEIHKTHVHYEHSAYDVLTIYCTSAFIYTM